jgi:hypothetical protein
MDFTGDMDVVDVTPCAAQQPGFVPRQRREPLVGPDVHCLSPALGAAAMRRSEPA